MDIKARILIVAGEADARAALAEPLRKQGHTVETASGAKALARYGDLAPDLVLLDVETGASGNGGGLHGAALLARLVDQDADVAVVAMVAFGDGEAGVAALAAGEAHDVTKPVNGTELSLVVAREMARRRLRGEVTELRARLSERYRFENIIGSSAPMQAVNRTVAQAAAGRTSVLLTGEPGTGKALIAAAIHEKSRRAHGPFVRVTCRGFAESALDGELFGQEHTAPSGAPRDGRLAQAQGGTLFLEEIDVLPVGLQVKLRRFLESGRFERAGGDQPIAADVRVIAAGGRDLPQLVADGQLREDLFRRLDAVHIEMPALRDRPSDVPLLALHFLQTFATGHGKAIVGLDDEALERLGGYAWPGNVRELEETIERAVSTCRGPRITAADLPPSLRAGTASAAVPIPGSTLDTIERFAILRTLEATSGSTGRAAEILGISIRKVQYKLQEDQTTPDSEPSKGSEPPAAGSGGGPASAQRGSVDPRPILAGKRN